MELSLFSGLETERLGGEVKIGRFLAGVADVADRFEQRGELARLGDVLEDLPLLGRECDVWCSHEVEFVFRTRAPLEVTGGLRGLTNSRAW